MPKFVQSPNGGMTYAQRQFKPMDQQSSMYDSIQVHGRFGSDMDILNSNAAQQHHQLMMLYGGVGAEADAQASS